MRKTLLVTSLLIALALPSLANPSFETLQKQGDSFLAKKNYSQAVKTFEKLVYLYLMNYAKTQPELVILAVNTFVKVRGKFLLLF